MAVAMDRGRKNLNLSDFGICLGTRHKILSFLKETFNPESVQIIVLCLFWYSSSALTNNLAKQIFQLVKCPVTLTYVQFAFVGSFCFLFGYFDGIGNLAPRSQQYGILDSHNLKYQMLGEKVKEFTEVIGPFFKKVYIMAASVPVLGKIFDLLLRFVFSIISILFSFFISIMSLIRKWVGLGLGIHTDHFSSSSKQAQIPQQLRLHGSHVHKPTAGIIIMMSPLSIFLISGHVFSSIAISNVPVSFVHTVKALSPLFTVLFFRLFWKTHYSSHIYLSLFPLTLGVMLACSYDLSFNLVGLVCSLLSTLIFVGQNIFSKKLFQEKRLDKMNMLLYSSFLSFIFMTPIWFWSEGYLLYSPKEAPAGTLPIAWKTFMNPSVSLLFLLNGLSHFGQNVFAFSILSIVSPVTYSIASLIKRIFVIVASIIWFGQNVGQTQSFGIIMTFIGLWMYQYAKMHGGADKDNIPQMNVSNQNFTSKTVHDNYSKTSPDVVHMMVNSNEGEESVVLMPSIIRPHSRG